MGAYYAYDYFTRSLYKIKIQYLYIVIYNVYIDNIIY